MNVKLMNLRQTKELDQTLGIYVSMYMYTATRTYYPVKHNGDGVVKGFSLAANQSQWNLMQKRQLAIRTWRDLGV
jgi:hypothetical protein